MKYLRELYYVGIGLLAIYSLPGIDFIDKYLQGYLEFELVVGFPIISIIALFVGFGAYQAYRRKFG